MGFLYYFFNMQCPDCGYICFKQAKDCGNCGFDFKKAATSAASPFRNDSFTIFAGSKIPAKGQESSSATISADSEEIAVMDAPEGSQENPEVESGDFLLNLSDAEQESSATALESTTSDSDTLEFTPLEFGADANINLEEVEVEGLGLGLEPLEDEAPALEINDLSAVSLEEKADIENAKEEETPKAPVLDLGEDEISLELDDSEGPLSTANTETSEIEIEDLGLELEDSDSPPDSEKP